MPWFFAPLLLLLQLLVLVLLPAAPLLLAPLQPPAAAFFNFPWRRRRSCWAISCAGPIQVRAVSGPGFLASPTLSPRCPPGAPGVRRGKPSHPAFSTGSATKARKSHPAARCQLLKALLSFGSRVARRRLEFCRPRSSAAGRGRRSGKSQLVQRAL